MIRESIYQETSWKSRQAGITCGQGPELRVMWGNGWIGADKKETTRERKKEGREGTKVKEGSKQIQFQAKYLMPPKRKRSREMNCIKLINQQREKRTLSRWKWPQTEENAGREEIH